MEESVLQSFKSNGKQKVFSEVQGKLPQFLAENLLDPQRIIKHFANDPQASVRIFYYQYLKLCFEMELSDYQSYIAKLQEIIGSQSFQFKFPPEKNKKIYNNQLAKRLVQEFIQYLDQEQITIQFGLSQYPIMDEIFICLIRSLLLSQKICKHYEEDVPRQKLFEFLASFFCLDIALYENCLKFIDSDVFMYQQNDKNTYMIYIDYQKQNQQCEIIHEQSDSESSSVQQIVSKINVSDENIQSDQDLQLSAQRSSGVYEFVDYTSIISTNNQQPEPKRNYSKLKKSYMNTTNLQNTNNIIYQVPEVFQELLSTTPKYTPNNTATGNYLGSQYTKVKQLQQTLENIKIRENSENIYCSKVTSVISESTSNPSKQFDNNRMFGRPISGNFENNFDNSIDVKGKINPFNNPRKVSSYAQSINEQYQYNYLKNLSNQFTNSLLLKQIREPFQTNIKMMKVRARAQRNALFHH